MLHIFRMGVILNLFAEIAIYYVYDLWTHLFYMVLTVGGV